MSPLLTTAIQQTYRESIRQLWYDLHRSTPFTIKSEIEHHVCKNIHSEATTTPILIYFVEKV